MCVSLRCTAVSRTSRHSAQRSTGCVKRRRRDPRTGPAAAAPGRNRRRGRNDRTAPRKKSACRARWRWRGAACSPPTRILGSAACWCATAWWSARAGTCAPARRTPRCWRWPPPEHRRAVRPPTCHSNPAVIPGARRPARMRSSVRAWRPSCAVRGIQVRRWRAPASSGSGRPASGCRSGCSQRRHARSIRAFFPASSEAGRSCG